MKSKTYFITGYMEFLLKQGLKYEETYVGDASRYLRFLLSTAPADSVEKFIAQSGSSPSYHRRLTSSLNRFLDFTRNNLEISNPEQDEYGQVQEAL
ncbi:MAG: hypothetical protein PHD88_03310 [Firmicutes bacterium]|nr:hypothetical protein [Bacillota bacterium]MDD4263108.1 hypothetical protein [Bacillota bacterium]MDD4693419.1 hypothetical protein [Bacillota bacterium]